jgi:enoyl-CoA hydratase
LSSQVVLERDGRVSTVALCHPDRNNVISAAMARELMQVLQDADAEDETYAIVLTGVGDWFCAGADYDSGIIESHRRIHKLCWHLIYRVLEIEKPIVAMVNGPAVGLGLTLALLCDSVLMSDEAYLADESVAMGLASGDGAALVLPLLIGPHRAKEMLLSGMRIDGPRAEALRLVNRSVPASALRGETYQLASMYADQPRYAARATKAVVNRYVRWMAHQVLDVGLAYQSVSQELPDYEAAARSRSTSAIGKVL